MGYVSSTPRERAPAAIGAALVTAAVGWALVAGLGVAVTGSDSGALDVFEVASSPPPERERVVPPPRRVLRPEGRAAPPNLRARPSEMVAPAPVVMLPLPPFLAAPVASDGAAAFAGAADRPGPGTGAGGEGDGLGGGGDGVGDGGGFETPPRQIRGRIRDGDYPRGAAEAGAGGTVSVRYFVEVNGRATRCMVTASSGNAELDATTCRLIEERFRFRPSRDAAGRPVRSIIVNDYDWVLERASEE